MGELISKFDVTLAQLLLYLFIVGNHNKNKNKVQFVRLPQKKLAES
jgi:hypothetical protein